MVFTLACPLGRRGTAPGLSHVIDLCVCRTRKQSSVWEMPAFKLKALDGTEHQLEEWRGKVILLNFWASWCPPCQYEIRDFVGYQAKYGDLLGFANSPQPTR